jgi:hypothetical protein
MRFKHTDDCTYILFQNKFSPKQNEATNQTTLDPVKSLQALNVTSNETFVLKIIIVFGGTSFGVILALSLGLGLGLNSGPQSKNTNFFN